MSDPVVDKIQKNPKYLELRKKRSGFGWFLTLLMMVVYYGYIALIAWNKPFLSQPLGAGVTTIGVPIGIIMGRNKIFRDLTNSPFQLMRMISPLSWEPIAVIVFAGWDSAIIFLIAIAAVWPITFSTAAGLSKVDPAWFKVARNLGAKPWQLVTEIIIPAIMFDVVTGIRLAVGVAWIVLVPAEFLGVTSGFGYTIEDARESLEYEHLMAMLLVIGAVGYVLDSICMVLIKRYSWHR